MTLLARKEFENNSVSISDDQATPFNVLIFYETQASAACALEIADTLEYALGRSFLTTRTMWKFDCLNLTKLREIATQDVIGAEVVIVAMEHDDALPTPLLCCIQSGVGPQSEGGRALIVSIEDTSAPGPNSALPGLRFLAKTHNLDFFSNIDEYAQLTRQE